MSKLKHFDTSHAVSAAWLWAASVQYFIVQLIVASDFKNGYSPRFNTISDLGNTACSNYGSRYVCSPLHSLMNVSFIVLGITMLAGALLLRENQPKNASTARLGCMFLATAGLGTTIVGLFPENTVAGLHILGAALPFVLGNIALLILGVSLRVSDLFRLYTMVSGFLALIALTLFISSHDFGLGTGGMERLTAYPQTLWLIVYGIRQLSTQKRQKSHET